ncbi:MAG TPA: CHAP domain-containing protein [Trebonia sp.]|nr:CHAP domain-containing protein [Trebonia sp.]
MGARWRGRAVVAWLGGVVAVAGLLAGAGVATSPVAVAAGAGWEGGFQASGGDLWSAGPSGGAETWLGMMAGTSPAAAALPGGGYEQVFQASGGDLWDWNSASGALASSLHLGMMAGTSPAIAALAGPGWIAAFQANTGQLWTVSSAGATVNTQDGMAPATSPAIAAQLGGGYDAVFQASGGQLWDWNYPSGHSSDTGFGMAPATSPAITALPGGSWEAAFQASGGTMWTATPSGGQDTWLGMKAGTSPTITAPASLGTEIASIEETQVGYQDSPAGTFCNQYSAHWQAGSNCGNGNYAEEWCADFAAWVWQQAGVDFTYGGGAGDINGAAASFYQWGIANGTWHPAGSGYTPQPGDAVIYGLNSSGSYADHVAIVTSYTPGDAGPNAVNGDWGTGTGNQGVIAASDETTDTGTDSISGYVSP